MRHNWICRGLEGDHGPYSYLQIIHMLQSGKLFPHELIYHPEEKSWKRIAECKEFLSDVVAQLRNVEEDVVKNVFAMRKYPRLVYKNPIAVFHNKVSYLASNREISEGGLGFELLQDLYNRGQNVFIHFNQSQELPAFNAVGVVVSKMTNNDTIKYGVKFSSINKVVVEQIRHLTHKKAA